VKGIVRNELLEIIRSVHAGKRRIPAALAQKLAEHMADEPISPRELEVLSLMAAGKRNKEIAGELSIAEDTVKMHVRNILSKLQVNDRTEAVTIALRRGIIHSNAWGHAKRVGVAESPVQTLTVGQESGRLGLTAAQHSVWRSSLNIHLSNTSQLSDCARPGSSPAHSLDARGKDGPLL